MKAIAPGHSGAYSGVSRERLLILLFLILAAIFLFVDARTVPIVLWDESRNVVNALEMRRSGLGLITTYDFQPDLWNTKPPLLIWLMTGSIALFGPSEWALRLPSALAAIGTLLICILFVRRVTGSIRIALGSALILLLSPGFFGEHGARTADYDSLLLFFTTAYLQLLFFAVHRPRPSLSLLLAAGALIACAVMTKSVAGLVSGVGVAAYLLLTGRWRRIVANPAYAAMAAAAALPVVAFYLAREAQAAGYIQAALRNEVIGRVRDSVAGYHRGPTTYARELVAGWFFAGPVPLAAPLAFRFVKGKSRALLLFALAVSVAPLLLYTLSATRILHYVLPVFPWLAIIAALTLRGLWRRIVAASSATRPGRPMVAAILMAGLLIAGWLTERAADWRYREFPQRQFLPQALYGEMFTALARSGRHQVIVVDHGFPLEGRAYYVPLLRAYRLIWGERGLVTWHLTRLPEMARVPEKGGLVASCDPATADQLLSLGPDVAGIAGCAAVSVAPPAPARS